MPKNNFYYPYYNTSKSDGQKTNNDLKLLVNIDFLNSQTHHNP